YQNEHFIGTIVKNLIESDTLNREDLFITTKVSPSNQGKDFCRTSIMKSLERLQLNYIDMVLIHHPGSNRVRSNDPKNLQKRQESWKDLEVLCDEGFIKNIGVSNYQIRHLEQLEQDCRIKPAVNQIELHPLYYTKDLVDYCQKNSIIVQAYSSLGSKDGWPILSSNDTIKEIAKKYGKSVAQILLRWALQHDFAIIPKTSNTERLKENFAVFDFEIASEDMNLLDGLNMGQKFCWDSQNRYGEEKIYPLQKPRSVTVLLNPMANKQKGKADYEKYCAPLFHLAGLKVSLVISEAEGQIKDLMEIMDNTDSVVLAGGDGTVHEALTGLFRRLQAKIDESTSTIDAKRYPIGILPIGRNNSIAYRLNAANFDHKKDLKAKILAECAMAIIRQNLSKFDVMHIKAEQGKSVFSLGDMNMGQLRNVLPRVNEYWYLGSRMKPYLAYFFQSFKNLSDLWDENQDVLIEYTEPCTGCSKCFQRFDKYCSKPNDKMQTNLSRRWWHGFLPKHNKTFESITDKIEEQRNRRIESMKTIQNDECDRKKSLSIKSKNLLVRNTLKNSIEMIVHSEKIGLLDFINEGVRMNSGEPFETVPSIVFKDCVINLENQISNREDTVKNEDENDDPKQTEQWISIDSESYEMQSRLRVELEPESVEIFINK
ncbi:Aldo-keto reductase-like protein 2, partial [Sarcoptes scabiei]